MNSVCYFTVSYKGSISVMAGAPFIFAYFSMEVKILWTL